MFGHDKRSFWYNKNVILSLFGNYTVVWTAEKSLLQHNSLFPCRCDIQVWLWGKGRKMWQSVFLQERRHYIASFLSSNSFYKFNFSAFLCKERSVKQKGNLCTWLYLCMRFSYAQYMAVPCNTNFKLSFCWLLSQLGVIMIVWFNDMIQIYPIKNTYYGYFWISATISPQISFLSLLKKRAMVINFFLG